MSSSEPANRFRLPLILQILAVYLLTVVIAVVVTAHSSIPLTTDGKPSVWLKAIWVLYYIVPLGLSLLLGLLFRPFALNFRVLFFFILIGQLTYSFVAAGFRQQYIYLRQDDVSKTFLARVQFSDFSHRFFDGNKDGLVDKVEFWGTVKTMDLPSGDYVLKVLLTQKGKPLANNEVASLSKELRARGEQNFKIHFAFDPQPFNKYFRDGEMEVNLSLQRIVSVDKLGKTILQFCRWSPYLRTASWEGEDPDIRKQVFDLNLSVAVDKFRLLPL